MSIFTQLEIFTAQKEGARVRLSNRKHPIPAHTCCQADAYVPK